MRELKQQLVSALLVVLTAAALVSAGINFQQQRKFPFPDDGVTWTDRDVGGVNRVVALHIQPESAAAKAGIKTGDVLTEINGLNVHTSDQATRALVRLGPWSRADYVLERNGLEIKAKVIVGERPFQAPLMYQYIVGAAYLGIGLFVYYRRATAPFATHFYILCLASFLLSTFHYTGKLNNFDKVMYWGNVAAGLFAPTIFLHFCLRFPGETSRLRSRWKAVLLYMPATAMMMLYVGFASRTLRAGAPLIEISWLLDRGWLLFLTVMYLAGGAVLSFTLRKTDDPITRQQLKWLRNGAVLGVVPFAAFNAIPYVFGAIPGPFMNLSALSLVFIPLTWAYAILRHRLMDVDVIFQQGYAYTLATLAVIGVLYSLIVSMGTFDEMPESTIALLVIVAMFLFQPIRNWIQEVLDRHVFYKDRYDYRRTLTDFARELSRETDLTTMLGSVSDRVQTLLNIRSVAFFLGDGAGGFRLVGPIDEENSADLDLSFLTADASQPLFFERTRHAIDTVSRAWPRRGVPGREPHHRRRLPPERGC
jgi:two-component system, NtrC family, sensor kinase